MPISVIKNWLSCQLIVTLLIGSRVAIAQYQFEHLSTAQGLSQSTIKVILQDRQGFMWFGTSDGLNRYDGYEFNSFRHKPNQPGSLCGNDIMAIHEDPAGRIWVGTRSAGFCYIDPQTGVFHPIAISQEGDDLSRVDVPAITHTAEGAVWIGTNIGLFVLQSGSSKPKRVVLPQPKLYIPALLTDAHDNLWIGTYRGQVLLKGKGQSPIRTIPLQIDSRLGQHQWVTTIHEDATGIIRVGTWGHGLLRWNATTSRFDSELYDAAEFEKRNIIKAIIQEKNGTLWLATDDGLVIAPGGNLGSVVHLKANPHKAGALTTHALQSLGCDSFGNVWVGTWEGGLNVYYTEAKRFRHITRSDGLPADRVTDVAAMGNHIAVASGQGLSVWNRQTNLINNILPGADVTRLVLRGSRLGVIIWNQGTDFFRFTPTSLKLTGQQRDANNPYRALVFTSGKKIIVGNTSSGLFQMDSVIHQLNTVLPQPPATSFGVATLLYESRSGQIFIGSYNQGLWVYDPQTGVVRPVGHQRQIDNEQILCLYEDSQQQLWVGTNGKGLFRYRPKTDDFVSFTTEDGLPNDVVNSIIEDDHHNLWIATNEGLSRFTPRTNAWRRYSEKDGLSSKEFMAQAVCKDERGYLYFGTMHGLTYFHPDSLAETKQQPRIYLAGLRLLNKPTAVSPDAFPLPERIDRTHEIRLNHQQAASITFEFVGLFFQKNPECHYMYRLDGFDEDWNNVGTQRNATYTNLPAGSYTFRVKASNSDGVWTNQDAHVKLVVLPPWYLSGWAYAGYSLLLLSALWVYRRFVRQREKLKAELRFRELEAEQANELEQLKTNFFTNVSHEFRTPLTLILDPVDQLLAGELPANKIQESYRVIQHNGQRLLRLINQLLDLSKIEAERYRLHLERADVVEFVQTIVQSFQFQADRKHVDLIFQANSATIMADFSPDVVEKIMFNLIANALKACQPGDRVTVQLAVTVHNDKPIRLHLIVADTGIGLSEQDQKALFSRFFQARHSSDRARAGTGIGLALTAELVKLHNGQIRFESQEAVGTTVTVDLSINAADFPADWFTQESSWQGESMAPTPEPGIGELPIHSNLQTYQLLVVEDNDELRTYLVRQLSEKYRVLSAENGQIGWELALKHVPDLIVSDVIMPGLTGIELCQRLKTDEKTSHIPLILLTSRSSVESQVEGLHTGADDYQTKPFTFQLLAARIQNLIAGRQRLREQFSRGRLIQPAQITVNDTDEQFLKKAIAVVEAHLSDATFDVEQLEQALTMSQMQLYRKLTSLTSMSGNLFIRHIRLHRAKQLLEESNLTVAEIAYRVGFNSPSYFTRAYKKEFGVLPSIVAQ